MFSLENSNIFGEHFLTSVIRILIKMGLRNGVKKYFRYS